MNLPAAKLEQKTKHTPGPWLREGTFIYALHFPVEPCFQNGQPQQVNRFSASIQHGTKDVPKAEYEANACLIAAAPDLLETVEWIASQQNLFFAECSQAEEIVARCKETLRKAKGEL